MRKLSMHQRSIPNSDRPDRNGRVEPSVPSPMARGRAASTRLMTVSAAVLVTGFMVMSVSRAAFTSTTTNPTNAMATGTLLLTDDDLDVAMFTLAGLGPGSVTSKCTTVTYAGSLSAAAVHIYAGGIVGPLATMVDVVIESGDGGSFDDCTGFTNAVVLYSGLMSDLPTTYATGAGTWVPSSGDSRTYRVTLTVQDEPGGAGLTANWGLVWETQSI